jgi:hypothetical protein
MAVSARQSVVGCNVSTTTAWGTATAVGAGDGVWVIDDLKTQLKKQVDEDDSAGQSFIGSMQVANNEVQKGELPMLLHFHDTFMNPLWALTCGTGGTAPTSAGYGYTNTFEPATNKTGLFATIVRDKVTFIEEVPSAKFTGFDLSFGANGRGMLTFHFLGDRAKVDSSTNTATQIAALTYPTQGLRGFFKDLVFRLNLASGGALGASDEYKVTDLKLSYSQKLDTLYVSGQDYVIQPEDDDYPDISLTVTFDRLTSTTDDFQGYHSANTSLKGDITITGPVLGTGTYKLLWQFPNLIVTDAPVPFKSGAKNVQPHATFKAYKAAAAPTGMTTTKPFRLTTTGVSSTNPFV